MPGGRQLRQQFGQRRTQRHARRDLRHHAQVEPVGADLAAREGEGLGLRRRRLGLLQRQREVAARPDHAIGGGETQALGGQLELPVVALGGDAPLQLRNRQRLRLGGQAQCDGVQRQVDRGGLRLALAQLDPGPQRAFAGAHLEGQRDMAAQLGHIGVWQGGEQAAVPAPPITARRQQRLREAALQREALAPGRRRRRVEADVVAAQAVAHHQIDVLQLQRRRVALFVDPAQAAVADHELMLREKPIGGRVVGLGAAGGDFDAGDKEAPDPVTAQFQRRAFNVQLLEAQLEGQQRARRQRRADLGQAQGFALLVILEHHIGQLQGRHPATRTNADRTDRDRCPDGAAGTGLDLRAPLFDARQNRPMQGQPCQQQ